MSKVTKASAEAGGVAKPTHLLTLGDYSLWAMPKRNHEIRHYNPATKLVEYKSARTRDDAAAIKTLEKLYHGHAICPECGQAKQKDNEGDDFIVPIINTYLTVHGEDQKSGSAIAHRLNHVKRYIGDKPLRVGNITEDWIKAFRKWMIVEPYYVDEKTGRSKFRKVSTVEGSVLQLRAAIHFANKVPLFKNKQPSKVAGKIDFRADIPLIAAMFRYALAKPGRKNLLYYLRLSVATWGRPEAVMEADLTPEAQQWVPFEYDGRNVGVFRLNPAHREQNNKYRAEVPIGERVAAWLDSLPKGPITPAGLSKGTWSRMMEQLKPDVPCGHGGPKSIRRAMATFGKKRLGRTNWIQGKFMGGWEQPNSVADGYARDDIYAFHEPEIMGTVRAVTDEIIEEIEALVPGAFGGVGAAESNVIPMAIGG